MYQETVADQSSFSVSFDLKIVQFFIMNERLSEMSTSIILRWMNAILYWQPNDKMFGTQMEI